MHHVGQLGLVVCFSRIVGQSLACHRKVDVVPVDLATKVIGARHNYDSAKKCSLFKRCDVRVSVMMPTNYVKMMNPMFYIMFPCKEIHLTYRSRLMLSDGNGLFDMINVMF